MGIVSVDYEHDRVYTPEQLATANQYLIAHARRGGLVTVTWSPLGPWMNDELDLEGNPGDWTDTRTNAAFLSGGADLRDVIDPTTEVGKVWRRKLERIADALAELRAAGVVVLWRPMQEMNGYWFWWGHLLQGDDSTAYQDIWRDMFRFFTYERRLDNLLWVHSPAQNRDSADGEQAAWVKDSDWAYPGTRYVDVVAGTAYRDDLHIPNYGDYLALPEVVAMAEFSAALMGEHDRDDDLDTTGRSPSFHPHSHFPPELLHDRLRLPEALGCPRDRGNLTWSKVESVAWGSKWRRWNNRCQPWSGAAPARRASLPSGRIT